MLMMILNKKTDWLHSHSKAESNFLSDASKWFPVIFHVLKTKTDFRHKQIESKLDSQASF